MLDEPNAELSGHLNKPDNKNKLKKIKTRLREISKILKCLIQEGVPGETEARFVDV